MGVPTSHRKGDSCLLVGGKEGPHPTSKFGQNVDAVGLPSSVFFHPLSLRDNHSEVCT